MFAVGQARLIAWIRRAGAWRGGAGSNDDDGGGWGLKGLRRGIARSVFCCFGEGCRPLEARSVSVGSRTTYMTGGHRLEGTAGFPTVDYFLVAGIRPLPRFGADPALVDVV